MKKNRILTKQQALAVLASIAIANSVDSSYESSFIVGDPYDCHRIKVTYHGSDIHVSIGYMNLAGEIRYPNREEIYQDTEEFHATYIG